MAWPQLSCQVPVEGSDLDSAHLGHHALADGEELLERIGVSLHAALVS